MKFVAKKYMKKEALLYQKLADNKVNCSLCAHRCKISPAKYGICGVRQNIDGILYAYVYGEAIANHVDPIEKKPFYHFLPGSSAYSIATVGCNFNCGFCQNWRISQLSVEKGGLASSYSLPPEKVVSEAKKNNCRSISYTYTEPTVFFEYALSTARLAKQQGLYNSFVTNGFMTPEALEMINPYLDACNVDLKSFNDDFYRRICKGKLRPVLDSIKLMKELGIWIEITTLVIPGENDSDNELKQIAGFIAGVGKEIPWHLSAFHPDYQFTDHRPTSLKILQRAKELGQEAGLRYVYLGNVREGSDLYCYQCGKLLIRRAYFSAELVNVENGRCSSCGAKIDGVWE